MDGQAVLVGKIEAADPAGRFTNHEVSLLGLDGIIAHLAGSSGDSGKSATAAMPAMAKTPKMVKSTSMEGLSGMGMGRARARTLTPDLGMDGSSGRKQPSLDQLNELIAKAKADKAGGKAAATGEGTGSAEGAAASSKGGAAAGKQGSSSNNITFMQMLKKEVEGRRAKLKDQGWGDLENDPMNHTVYGTAMHQQTIHGGEVTRGGKGGE